MDYEVQRFCWFDTAQAQDTIWKYKRAIEGHKLVLVDVEFICNAVSSSGAPLHIQIYDGHTFSVWGSFPGIFDQATLRMATLIPNITSNWFPLNNWECKEFTLSCRNVAEDFPKICVIVYFYEIPMTNIETLEYAVKQPRYKYRHGFARTADIEEGGGYG